MTAQINNRLTLIGLALAIVGGIGALASFVLGQNLGPVKYVVLPVALIGIGMMVAAKFTPVQD